MQAYLDTLTTPYMVYLYFRKDVLDKVYVENKTWINMTFHINYYDDKIQNDGDYIFGYAYNWHPLMEQAEEHFVVQFRDYATDYFSGAFHFHTIGTFRLRKNPCVPDNQLVIDGKFVEVKFGSNILFSYLNYIHKGFAFVQEGSFDSFNIVNLPKVAIKSCKNT